MEKKISENIIDLLGDIGEVALDSFLNEGLLKDIPFFGTGIKVIKLYTNISDTIMLRKIVLFMQNLNSCKQCEIDDFINKMNSDKYRKEIGVKLISIIDKIDEDIKIKWIAKTFLDYLSKKITKDFFFRIITIINNSFTQDILKLTIIAEKNKILSFNKKVESYILYQLFSNGLLDDCGIDGGAASDDDSGTIFVLNDFGNYIFKNLL